MAMTASLAANPTTVTAGPNGTSAFTLTVSNSANSIVRVIGLKPYVLKASTQQPHTAVNIDAPTLNASNDDVAAAGSSKYYFNVDFHDPQVKGVAGGPVGGSTKTFDVGCYVVCSDGTEIYPTVVTITVNESPHS